MVRATFFVKSGKHSADPQMPVRRVFGVSTRTFNTFSRVSNFHRYRCGTSFEVGEDRDRAYAFEPNQPDPCRLRGTITSIVSVMVNIHWTAARSRVGTKLGSNRWQASPLRARLPAQRGSRREE